MNSIKKLVGKHVIVSKTDYVDLYYGILNEFDEHGKHFNVELLDCKRITSDDDDMLDIFEVSKNGPLSRDQDDYQISSSVNSITIFNIDEICECQKKAIHKIESFPTQEEFEKENMKKEYRQKEYEYAIKHDIEMDL